MAASQVAEEQATGAMDIRFMHTEMTMAYKNITNVVLKITPKGAHSAPAVLVNAHFDSTLGSAGGSEPYRRGPGEHLVPASSECAFCCSDWSL